MSPIPRHFIDSNLELIPYDGSKIEWRISVHGMVIQDGKLLVVRQKNEKLFDLPGGGIEMDESFEEALAREGLEEAGWALKLGKPILTTSNWFFHTAQHKFYKSLYHIHLASGKQISETPTDPRIEVVTFLPLDKLDAYPIYPNIFEALKQLK